MDPGNLVILVTFVTLIGIQSISELRRASSPRNVR